MTATADVVVVSFNSRRHLRRCVEALASLSHARVFVVDNASEDGSLEVVADLPVEALQLDRNGGFAAGCNAGWRAGDAPYVLLLNPDATIDADSLSRLVERLESSPQVGAVGPKIVDVNGALEYSQRRFPRLRSTYAQALFLHRLFPAAGWADEVVREAAAYERSGPVEWISGACVLLRRSALERLNGLDEHYFHYCEDIDLCRRLWDSGFEVHYEAGARCVHLGGGSAPRPALLPRLAASRLRYARKHSSNVAALLERIGIGLGALTHAVVARGGRDVRAGHARALRQALLSSEPSSD